MTPVRRRGLPAQTLFGGLLLTIGLLLFLQNFGWLDGQVWQFWPLLLMAVGLLKLLAPGGTFDRLFGLGLLAFGSLRIASRYFALAVSPVDIVAGLLVVFGVVLLWRGLFSGATSDGPPVEVSDTISALAFMGGYATRCNAPVFRGGDVTAFMGGIELDLRGSQMQSQAVVDIFVMWGGVDIRVPADWVVELRGMPILGGFEDKTQPTPPTSPKRLIVRGAVIMGGIDIKN